jgi:CDGSH-type Zn-finger protein
MAAKVMPVFKKVKEGMKIVVSCDGPYCVMGGIPLFKVVMVCDEQGLAYAWREGETYPLQQEYTLCRCGGSLHKPFCDGTHVENFFDGSETASRALYLDQADETAGPELDLTDAAALCASARFCDRDGGVWDRTRQSSDPRSKQVAICEVGNCPAGRLAIWDKAGNAIEPDFEPSIGLVEDPYLGVRGALWVRGGIPIESAGGAPFEVRNRVTLCRCGLSANKPFCDGKHEQDKGKSALEKIK